MDDKFKDLETLFNKMRLRFRKGEISQREFSDSLKQLRIKDEEGRFWMIGAQTGKWYYFSGDDWVRSSPPSIKEKKAICIYCGFENDLETAVCARCGGRATEKGENAIRAFCPDCGTEIRGDDGICPQCSRESPSAPEIRNPAFGVEAAREEERTYWLVRSVNPLSFLWFWGGLGVAIGILTGLFVGATAFFPGAVEILPAFFKDMQGKLVGGIIFTAIGGGLGFLAFSVIGFLTALVINAVLSFFGGLKIRIEKTAGQSDEDRT